MLRLRTLFLFCLAVTFGMLLYGFTLPRPQDSSFTVIAGDSAQTIAQRLKAQGFIRSASLFSFVIRTAGLSNRLQPGIYDLSFAGTVYGIAEALSGKGGGNEITLRTIEGWNIRDIQKYLATQKISGNFLDVTGTPAVDFRRQGSSAGMDWAAEFPFLRDTPPYVSLEGYLFPDTYRVYKSASVEDVVRTMLKNFEKKLTPQLQQQIAASKKSIFSMVTMASILEREVQTDQDRKMVADIFWRRLAKNMPLQADSTVNYATGKSSPAVSAQDLSINSPYNTYKNRGLPLGPICNPGLSAINAAMSPTPNDYWYFLTDSQGKVYYARTFEEHVANKNKYLK